jgi:hypothetical protein
MSYFETTKLKNSGNQLINPATEENAVESSNLLLRILTVLMSPIGFDKTLNRFRNTAIIESGTVTTVSTVSTVSNISTIDGFQGRILMNGQNLSAWAQCNRSRIT